MKKINRFVSVLLVLISIVSLLMCETASASAVSKIKNNKGDFYLKLNKSLVENSYNYTESHSYKPAKSCNKEIFKYYNSYFKSDYSAYKDGYSMVYYIDGSAFKNGNILSIRQKLSAPSSYKYKCYNINKKTGKLVTLKQLYKKYGYTKESFYNELKKKQINKTKKRIGNAPGLDYYSDMMISYAKSDESRKDLQAYIDKNGKLCVYANLSTMAGADIYQFVFKFDKK